MMNELKELNNLREMIDHNAVTYIDRPVFLYKDEKGGEYKEITFAQLKADVDALGTAMMSMGLKGEKVAVIGSSCYSWVVAYFATVCGVGVVVPLDKELSKNEIVNLLERSNCKAIFFTDEFTEAFDDLDIEYKIRMKQFHKEITPVRDGVLEFKSLIKEGWDLYKSGDRSFVDADIDNEAMSMLLFTSGTTGIAKGVMLSHKNVMNNIKAIAAIVKVYPEDRSLSILPIHHTFESNIGIITVMCLGASIAFGEGLKYVAKNLAEAKATVLIGVPLIFESMYSKIWKEAEKTGRAKTLRRGIKLNRTLKAMGINQERKIFSSIYSKFGGKLRLVVTGAAAIDPNVIRGFEDLGIMVLQGYGLTECSPLVAGTPENGNRYKHAGSVGPSVSTGEIKIIDEDEEGIGEIIYRGPNVMLGYYEMPKETAEVLDEEGWFHTGDLGFIGPQGWLYVSGRKKNVIVTKTGKNIYPEEIEAYLQKNKYIDEVIVYGHDDSNDAASETKVAALIKPDIELLKEEKGDQFVSDDDELYNFIKRIIADLNEGLPIYKRIRNVSIRREEFVKTTTKKIKRHENI